MKTIEITDEEYQRHCQGEEITIKPPPKKWEPKKGNYIFFTDGEFHDNAEIEYDQYTEAGAERDTETDAERAAKRVVRMNRLSAWAAEHGYERDYNPNNKNWTIYFDGYGDKEVHIIASIYDYPGIVWMTKEGVDHFYQDYYNGLIEL